MAGAPYLGASFALSRFSRSQYGDLHSGQTLGGISRRGIHSCLHRVQVSRGKVIIVMGATLYLCVAAVKALLIE